MYNKKLSNEVLNINRNTFKALHNSLHFDFEKDFFIAKIETPFTINSIVKKYGFSDFVLLMDGGKYCRAGFYTVVVNNCVVNIDCVSYALDYYCRKSDFEEARKGGSNYRKCDFAYIIAQDSERKTIKPENNDFSIDERFYKSCKNFRRFRYGHNESATLTAENGKVFYFGYDDRLFNANSILDKSGYCVAKKRETLANAAKRMHNERSKNAMLAKNTEKEMQEISKIRFCLPTIMQKIVISGMDHETIRNNARKIENISWLVFDIELFEKRVTGNEYTNIDSFNKAYNAIIEKYNNLSEGVL